MLCYEMTRNAKYCYEMTCNVMKCHSMWCNVIEYYDLQYFAMPSLTISLKCYLKSL
jgi:hypothetical protein